MIRINTQTIIGLILLIMGLIIFLVNLDVISADFSLFIIGGGLIAGYFLSGKVPDKRKVGFLTAGLLVSMVGIFDIVDNYISPEFSGSIFFALLGTAFLLIYLIHTFNSRQGSKWPFYIALCIYAFSLFIYLIEVVNFKVIEVYVRKYWPLLITAIGVFILFNGMKNSHLDNKKEK